MAFACNGAQERAAWSRGTRTKRSGTGGQPGLRGRMSENMRGAGKEIGVEDGR